MNDDGFQIAHRGGGYISIDCTTVPDLLFSLGSVPEILTLRETGPAQARLYPDVQPGHAEENLQWHETMDDDLRHLFESASDTLARDLDAVEGDRVRFPEKNLPAWMSAINQARLILGEVHAIREADMARRDLNVKSPRDLSILHVHMLGALLEALIRV